MLPQSHIAYTWLAASLVESWQRRWQRTNTARNTPNNLPRQVEEHGTALDYRWPAVAAVGPDLIDKPLAALYFYRKYKSAVLFAHTLILNLLIAIFWLHKAHRHSAYLLAFLGHLVLDRIWFFPATFYWPLRGWRFHVWGKRGSEQTEIGKAYWVAFTRRPELWGWELGGLLALGIFVWRHRLWEGRRVVRFLLRGEIAILRLQ